MTHKQLSFRAAAREKVLRGATALADAVRVTLGPKSKCVLIEKKWGEPLVCNDGVTIAKEVDLKDAEENLGAQRATAPPACVARPAGCAAWSRPSGPPRPLPDRRLRRPRRRAA